MVDQGIAPQSQFPATARTFPLTTVSSFSRPHLFHNDPEVLEGPNAGILKEFTAYMPVLLAPGADSIETDAKPRIERDLDDFSIPLPRKSRAECENKLPKPSHDKHWSLTSSSQTHREIVSTEQRPIETGKPSKPGATLDATTVMKAVEERAIYQKAEELVATARDVVQAITSLRPGSKRKIKAAMEPRQPTAGKRVSLSDPTTRSNLAAVATGPRVVTLPKETWVGDALLAQLDKRIDILKTKRD
jgi:hypothetical protein